MGYKQVTNKRNPKSRNLQFLLPFDRLSLLFFPQYEKLNKLLKDFEPYKNLWLTTSDWSKWHDGWMNDPLTTIDAEQLENNVSNSFKTMHKCVRHFQEVPSVQNIANEIKGWIEDFKPFIPLIQGLRNPGMRSRHWDQVRDGAQKGGNIGGWEG